MNNITAYDGKVSTHDTKAKNKTENGTPIVNPGEEASQDIFLKLLVAQMTNQDPFNPQDPTQYVTQLAQFTTLDQIMSVNKNMEYLMGMGNGLLVNSAMATASSLIGKNVEVYAPTEETGEKDETDVTDEKEEKKTLTGVVEGVNIKDGIVYMDIRVDGTGELKSIEYSSLIKVSDKNISIDNDTDTDTDTDNNINTDNEGEK